MNRCIIELDEIRSYQTLIYKNGYRTFPTKAYKFYKQELAIGMRQLTPIPPETPLRCVLTANIKEGVLLPQYRVKMLTTDNTVRKFDTEIEAKDYHSSDRHYIEYSEAVVRYGACADTDNLAKPILDYLEESGVIDNDRFIVDMQVVKTFNNTKNTIEIELEELSPVGNDVISFK